MAAFSGISAACSGVGVERLGLLYGTFAALAGGRALYEVTWGLSAWASRVRESAPVGDALAVLNRLEQGRPYGGFLTPAALGCFLAMTIPAVAAWSMGKQGRSRAVGLAAAAVGAGGLVATRSVSAMVALAAALLLAGLRGRMALRLVAIATGAIVLAILAAGIARPDAVFAPTREDSPWRLRAGNVRVALAIARDHPLAGVGPGGYAEAFPQYRRPGDNESRHAHDLPAELIAEWGIPVGLTLSACFFWLFLGPLARGARDPRTLESGLTIGIAAFAVHNLIDFTAFLPSLLLFAAVSRGLIAGRVARERAWPPGRAAWVALFVVIAALIAGSGLARDALFDAREAAASGDHAGAERLAVRAQTFAPWDADPPQFTAEARLAAAPGDVDALADAERAVLRAPSRAAARAVRARARSAAGDAPGAQADFAAAASLYPMRPDYAAQRDAFADALRKAGEAAPR